MSNFLKDKNDLVRMFKNLAFVLAGTFVLSFGVAIFILPNDLVTGGIPALAILVERMIPFEFFTVDIAVTVLTWFFFFLGLIFLGKSFAVKTLISAIFYPMCVSILMHITQSDFFGGFFDMASGSNGGVSLIVSAVFGGFCVGVGCALTFLGGGSTGGVDIIAFIICKIFKRAKSAVVMFCVDSTIILLGAYIIKDFTLTLLGILSATVSALMIDKVLLGGKGAYVAEIVTDKPDEINKAIITEVDRTTTILNAVGGYSGRDLKLLIVSFTMREYAELMNVVSRYDKNAFMTIHRAHEINGEGWSRERHVSDENTEKQIEE